MKNIENVEVFITKKLSVFVFILIFSCSQKKEQYPSLNQTSDKIIAPSVTILANLPDSSKPKIIFLENTQKPKRISISKPPLVHSFIDSITHATIAPEIQGNCFYTSFTTDDGLALDAVFCSAMDKNGNLWFGSGGGGVSRYDGKGFTNYTIKHGLADNSVMRIKEDKKGNLWFGTWGGGVSRYDGKSFTNYTTAQGLSSNYVLCITEDKKGKLWFGTGGGGISSYDGKSFTNYNATQGLANDIVWSTAEDKNGILWFGTIDGLSRYDGRSFVNYTTAQGLTNNFIYSITEDKTGKLWFSSRGGGISSYDGKKFTNYTTAQGLANNYVYYSTEDKTGNLWFGTYGGGISRYDGKSFTNYTTAQGLSKNDVFCITEDGTGNLWFGTGGGGINRYDGKTVINYTGAHGLGNSLVFGMTEDKSGNLWFGTSGNGASRYDGKSFTNFTTAQGLVSNFISCIIQDKSENLWFGTGDAGVSRYDGKSFTNYTMAQGLSSNFITCITQDKSENIWFGTPNAGINRYDGKSFTNYSTAQGLAKNYITSSIEDKKGNLWFGIRGGGASRYDRKSFTNYTTAQGLVHNNVECIKEDKTGNLWFGTTGGGISRYDGKSFINYSAVNGLPDNNVVTITVDSASNIVVGTNSGIGILVSFVSKLATEKKANSISAQNSLSNEELKNYIPQFEIYNSSTGYPIKDVNGQTMITDSKGIIWMGTGAAKIGLVRFDRSALHKSNDSPVVVLQSIKVNNENICWYDLVPASVRKELVPDSNTTASNITEEVTTLGKVLSDAERDSMRSKFSGIKFDSIRSFYPVPENLVLPYQQNNITFDFAAIELNRPRLVKYQYVLEGYDKNWNSPTNKTSATYGNMYEGDYTFKIKAQSPSGIWSKTVAYTFRVLPPVWRTWWAFTLYILVFLVLLWSFIRWRIGALREEKILLEEKIMIRTHELHEQKEKVESALSELKATQSQLIQSEKMASLGELTAGIAHEIQNPLNFINNFSEVNTELSIELGQEAEKGNIDDVKLIANDIKENSERINYHGKRADAIVKNMLQHSRQSKGAKEPTDINALCDEYLRLSYHGLRAKDNTFNADLKKDFDETIGKINIVPQDISRVLLNLFNNAFYATNEKRRAENPAGQENYKSLVSVQTKKIKDEVEIRIIDNGHGIPQNLFDKIFQPFFTTKPTGEGTGLGLSLAYDIVKAHGGELNVESKEGEHSIFTISLPLN